MKNLLKFLIISPFVLLSTLHADSVTTEETLQNDVEIVSNTYAEETKNDKTPYVVNVVEEADQTKMQGDGTGNPANEIAEPNIEPENLEEQKTIAKEAVVDLNQKLSEPSNGEKTSASE